MTAVEEKNAVAQLNSKQEDEEVYVAHSLYYDAWQRFKRNRLAMIGLVVVLMLIGTAIFADVLAPYGYADGNFAKTKLDPFEDPAHLLGTDALGRDVLSRIIYGARISLSVSFILQFIAFGIGVPLGAASGYFGGWVDFIIQRLVDVMSAFPGLLFAIFLLGVFGGGVEMLIITMSITGWVGITRLTRAQFLTLREKEFIVAAQAIGASQSRLIFRHVLPNAISPLLVALSFGIPGAIFGEAGLSFLGLGINDPIPSWGKMVGAGLGEVRVHWHLSLLPTFLIAITMLAFSFVGDGLQDALNPRSARRA